MKSNFTQRVFYSFFVFFLLLVLETQQLSAAPESSTQPADVEDSRGRLPDGRAFRTDAEGNQLVDYIAELELTIEALTRQVRGLEGEVKDKQAAYDLLQKNQSAAVKEKELIAAPQLVEVRKAPKASEDVRCESARKELQMALDLARNDLEVERQLGTQKIAKVEAEFSAKLAKAEEDLQAKEKQVVALQTSLSDRENQTSAALVALADTRKEVDETRSKLAAYQQPATPSEDVTSGRAALSLARSRAVDSIRGRLNTEINQLRRSISTRDELYRKYSSRKRAVAFTPAKTVSSRGFSVKQLEKQLKHVESVADISLIGRDLSEIARRVQEDIGLMQRMDRAAR